MARRKEIEVQTRLGARKIDMEKVIYFPRGLMGFETRHEFTLLQLNPGAPFLVLQSLDDPALGLLVADPYTFFPEYRIRVGNAEQSLLRIRHIRQVAVLVTVSIPHNKPEKTTINLMGPILVNHEMRVGLQVPQAEGDFPAQLYVYKVPARPVSATPDTAKVPPSGNAPQQDENSED